MVSKRCAGVEGLQFIAITEFHTQIKLFMMKRDLQWPLVVKQLVQTNDTQPKQFCRVRINIIQMGVSRGILCK